jgi:Flp pilus assembly pilin Flp
MLKRRRQAYWHSVLQLLRGKAGQDLIEYALTAAFIAVAVAAFFPTSIAPNISTVMSKVTNILNQSP